MQILLFVVPQAAFPCWAWLKGTKREFFHSDFGGYFICITPLKLRISFRCILKNRALWIFAPDCISPNQNETQNLQFSTVTRQVLKVNHILPPSGHLLGEHGRNKETFQLLSHTCLVSMKMMNLLVSGTVRGLKFFFCLFVFSETFESMFTWVYSKDTSYLDRTSAVCWILLKSKCLLNNCVENWNVPNPKLAKSPKDLVVKIHSNKFTGLNDMFQDKIIIIYWSLCIQFQINQPKHNCECEKCFYTETELFLRI